MSALALDDVQWHALAAELENVRVKRLMRGQPTAYHRAGGM
jgi:hypothetical protein